MVIIILNIHQQQHVIEASCPFVVFHMASCICPVLANEHVIEERFFGKRKCYHEVSMPIKIGRRLPLFFYSQTVIVKLCWVIVLFC